MFNYEKRLQYPVRIHRTDAKMAKAIITQFGGPDGETGASLRYLSQRFAMPYREVMGILTDIGTEELNHIEMICTIVHQLTRNLTVEQIKEQGFADYYVDHTTGLWPQASSGVPFSAATFQSTGDPITDLMEDLAADGAGIRTTKTLCQTVCLPRSPLHTPPQKHLTWRCSQCFFGNLTSG